MLINTEYAYAELFYPHETEDYTSKMAMQFLEANLKLTDCIILEELSVRDPQYFGQGHGKSLFHHVLNTFTDKNIVFVVKCVDFKSKHAFSGREEFSLTVDELKGTDILYNSSLMNKFYIPNLEKSSREYKIFKTELGLPIVVVFKDKKEKSL